MSASEDRMAEERDALNGTDLPNTRALDLHPESPADWPVVPVAVRPDGSVWADIFSWSHVLARLAIEWTDFSDACDADVSYSLDRLIAAKSRTIIEDGWAMIGEQAGDDCLIYGLDNLWRPSAAQYQPARYPIVKLTVPLPYGAGETMR